MQIPRSLSVALPPFILTRGFVLAIFIIVPCLTSHDVGYWRELSVKKDVSTASALRQTLSTGDSIHYQAIADHGYQPDEQHWAFFPVYPLLASLSHADFYITATVVSNLCFLIALVLLFLVAQEFGLTEEQATRAVWLLAVFPVSYFSSMAMSESVFLSLTLLSVYFALRDQWWLAGVVGAVSSATRVTGVVLLLLLALLYWQRKGTLKLDALSLLLVPVGLIAFMSYAWTVTGSPLTIVREQSLYDRKVGTFFLRPLIEFVLHPRGFEGWQFAPLSFTAAVLVFFCVYKLARKKEWALAVYSLVCIVVPLSTGILTSLPRYSMVVFPIYFVLAKIEQHRMIAYAFTVLFALLTLMCALHYNFALT